MNFDPRNPHPVLWHSRELAPRIDPEQVKAVLGALINECHATAVDRGWWHARSVNNDDVVLAQLDKIDPAPEERAADDDESGAEEVEAPGVVGA